MSNELGNTPADKDYKPSGISKAEEDYTHVGATNDIKEISKAEKAALKAYPNILFPFTPLDLNAYRRGAFIQGYEQAEKDLGWISVKNRLPDSTEYVFTCVDMQGKPQCVGFHYYKDGKWYEGYEEDTVGAVEYWMPIPNLPKK